MVDLPEELREAIGMCQQMKIRGRSRQKRLICQMLRAEDHEAITQRIDEMEARIAAATDKEGMTRRTRRSKSRNR